MAKVKKITKPSKDAKLRWQRLTESIRLGKIIEKHLQDIKKNKK